MNQPPKQTKRQINLQANRLCALIVGHTRERPGATNLASGMNEFEFNSRLAKFIAESVPVCSNTRVSIVVRKTYRALPDEVNALNPDFCISLHCNAFNAKTSGTQTLYYQSSVESKALAEKVQQVATSSLGLRDRGVVAVKDNGRGAHLLKNVKAPCVIAEPFFIDNDSDLKQASERFEELGRSFARFIQCVSL